jgi:hypothetical protein
MQKKWRRRLFEVFGISSAKTMENEEIHFSLEAKFVLFHDES